MVDEQGDERRGAQRESPAEREAKKNPANKQDLEKPSEGRDKPPDETVEKGKRSPTVRGWAAARDSLVVTVHWLSTQLPK